MTVLDYAKGLDGLPKSNVVKYLLEENSFVVVRSSGTEPKLKVYISVNGKTQKDVTNVEAKLSDQIQTFLTRTFSSEPSEK